MITTKQYKMDAEIAKIIVSQLGGRKFEMMVGAKEFGYSKEDLMFKIMRNAAKVSHVKVYYDYGADLYDIEFSNRRFSTKKLEWSVKVIEKLEGVSCEDLISHFERVTGLRTKLF